ncbi:putative immunodominant antigen, putative,tc40 antigen-like [Trypanosoma rangeli]|uniref:Putative immunodominant antigen, putative,tc40 antigen-like n=1 Tax=Trypanosoma rangeli TaxID=5698 RepID=A0A3R7NEG9_TRYRA|nr:putative immunodominant antigen, putative,tc40 antigen-like [Trypanosoma rangeli]RNF01498.1 putative immunodominant antigen, putative,tc40 antigen-like [Trypanosoma rangeli]|eukprot:RNF01498.1 putative immunodominant antigen, putative,tc40 antigen-like [Trypanosoma rangeli]
MTVTVNLFNHAKASNMEGRVWSVDAATFNEVPEAQRVLADSQFYLAYTMKRRHVLRVVKRSNLLKGSVRAHSKPIHSVRFVNYRSNVAASAGEGEFFVWVVTDETEVSSGDTNPAARLTVKVYFKLRNPVTVPCFSFFINAESQRPDLLVLYETQAAILDSSSLIERFHGDSLEATLQQNCTTLRTLSRPVSENSLCSVGSGGWFTFTTEPTMVVACTLRNRSTPSWSCCEGEKVTALHLLDTTVDENAALLVAASTKAVYQWLLTGMAEPTLLRKFVVDGSIVAVESSRETFAVFNDREQLALVSMQSPNNFICTHYMIPCQVQRNGFCFNRTADGCCVLADMSNRLTIFHLKSSPREEQQQGQKPPAVGTGKQEGASLTPDTSNTTTVTDAAAASPTPVAATAPFSSARAPEPRAAKKIIANLVSQLGLNVSKTSVVTAGSPATLQSTSLQPVTSAPQRTSSYGHSSRPVTAGLVAANNDTNGAQPPLVAAADGEGEGATTARVTSPATAHGTRPALHNSSLPQAPTDGVLAAAVYQSEEDVSQAVAQLNSVITNTLQVLKLLPDTVRRDHEQLLNLGLEAQMTELQRSCSTPPTQSPSHPADAKKPSVFETYTLVLIADSLSRNITKGVKRGVDQAMTLHLDHEVRNAIGNRMRQTQKNIIKSRVDDALRESATQFVAHVTQTVENVVKRELAEVFGSINGSLTTLVKENASLQNELNAIMSSGVVDEMRRMQKELCELRETVDKQTRELENSCLRATNTYQGPPQSPEIILATTQSLMQERQYLQGLEYLLGAQQPSLLLQFFTTLTKESENTYLELIETTAMPNDVWCMVLMQLVEAAETEVEKEVVVSIASDIIAERDQLLQDGAHGAKLTSALRTFEEQAKSETTNRSFLKCLKGLKKQLQVK